MQQQARSKGMWRTQSRREPAWRMRPTCAGRRNAKPSGRRKLEGYQSAIGKVAKLL